MLVFDHGFPLPNRAGPEPNIAAAMQAILRNIGTKPTVPLDLREGLTTLLDSIETSPWLPSRIQSRAVLIAFDSRTHYTQSNPPTPYAYTAGACIWLCQRTFKEGQDRLNAVLLHELVHVLCGLELDGEMFEHLLFDSQGATPPDDEDIKTFARKNWKGRWVRIVNKGGVLVVTNHWGSQVLRLAQGLSDSINDKVQNMGLNAIPQG